MSRAYIRTPSLEEGLVMTCTDCGVPDAMRRTGDLIDNGERTCGEIWTCTECGAENFDEW